MEEDNYEGWRVSVDEGEEKKGWCLLRPSIHDPLCVLNIESEVAGGNLILWCWFSEVVILGLKKTAIEIMKFFETECSDLPLDLILLDDFSKRKA